MTVVLSLISKDVHLFCTNNTYFIFAIKPAALENIRVAGFLCLGVELIFMKNMTRKS